MVSIAALLDLLAVMTGPDRSTITTTSTMPPSRPHHPEGLGTQVQNGDDTSSDRVPDSQGLAACITTAGELDAQPAVDDTHDHQGAPVPDVHVGDGAALRMLQVVPVVQPAANGLQGHQAHDDRAKLGVYTLEALFCLCDCQRLVHVLGSDYRCTD